MRTDPGSGVKMKIWTCYAGIAAQAWYYTDDNRLAVEGQGQCLDLPSGGQWNGNVLQTWQCATGNNNQAWTYSSSAKRDLEGRDDCSSSGSGSNSGTGNSVTQPSGKVRYTFL
jgi:hypothetical protein